MATRSTGSRNPSRTTRTHSHRGFAAMAPEEHRRISAMGGHASHGPHGIFDVVQRRKLFISSSQ